MRAQGIAEFQLSVRLSDNSPRDLAGLGWGYAEAGQKVKARQIVTVLEKRSHERYVTPEALARVYAALNEKDLAMECLEQAYRMRVDTLNDMNVDPCYDNMRSDPRVQDLVRRMNFPQVKAWGGWWDLNPRHPESQSGATTD